MKSQLLYDKFKSSVKIYVILLYGIALLTNSFTGSGNILGFQSLLFGGLTILFGLIPAFVAWSANLTFLIAITRKHHKVKLLFSGLSLIMGSAAIMVNELPIHEGSTTSSVKIGIGFYFWASSFSLLFIDSIINYKKSN
ncbi:hypothetical protein [Robertkochia sediminum]|uniref:hypothetical protein n=1 Tax=Robertkochia sediminum TaxID=2785326 RepID=UPI001931660F|nr:hypothetical protein [Robertkochia sediminum]MBL7471220.1 hypothetical protein [Robertkochia sediminum]